MNAPTLYERFIVPEGQRKVTFVADTKIASAGTFTVQREDHTLGNLIRMCVCHKPFMRPVWLCVRPRVANPRLKPLLSSLRAGNCTRTTKCCSLGTRCRTRW